jgi:hypothetical protein
MMSAISSRVGGPALFPHEFPEAFDDDGLIISAPIRERLVKSHSYRCIALVDLGSHGAFSPTHGGNDALVVW